MLRIEVFRVATPGGRVTDARRFEARCHFHFKLKKIPRIRHLDTFTLKAALFHRNFGNVQHKNPEALHPYVVKQRQQAFKSQLFTLSARRFNIRKF